jgi:hypothetical protein
MGIADRAMAAAMSKMLPAGIDPEQFMATITGVVQIAQRLDARVTGIEKALLHTIEQNAAILRLLQEHKSHERNHQHNGHADTFLAIGNG